MPRLMMTIKALTIRVMIGHKEDNNPNDDSECDNKRDDDKINIDMV